MSAYLAILQDTLPLHVLSLSLLIIASVKEVAFSPVHICWLVCLFASRITGNQINGFRPNLAERPRAKAKRDPLESFSLEGEAGSHFSSLTCHLNEFWFW